MTDWDREKERVAHAARLQMEQLGEPADEIDDDAAYLWACRLIVSRFVLASRSEPWRLALHMPPGPAESGIHGVTCECGPGEKVQFMVVAWWKIASVTGFAGAWYGAGICRACRRYHLMVWPAATGTPAPAL